MCTYLTCVTSGESGLTHTQPASARRLPMRVRPCMKLVQVPLWLLIPAPVFSDLCQLNCVVPVSCRAQWTRCLSGQARDRRQCLLQYTSLLAQFTGRSVTCLHLTRLGVDRTASFRHGCEIEPWAEHAGSVSGWDRWTSVWGAYVGQQVLLN